MLFKGVNAFRLHLEASTLIKIQSKMSSSWNSMTNARQLNFKPVKSTTNIALHLTEWCDVCSSIGRLGLSHSDDMAKIYFHIEIEGNPSWKISDGYEASSVACIFDSGSLRATFNTESGSGRFHNLQQNQRGVEIWKNRNNQQPSIPPPELLIKTVKECIKGIQIRNITWKQFNRCLVAWQVPRSIWSCLRTATYQFQTEPRCCWMERPEGI